MTPPPRSVARHAARVRLASAHELLPVCVTLSDAAKLLSISETTFRRKLLFPPDGPPAITSILVGNRRVIWLEELTRWAAAETERLQAKVAPSPSITSTKNGPLSQAVERALGRSTKRPRIHRRPDE